MRKLIIYLDQNFISDIAKQSLEDKKDKVNPLLIKLFAVMKSGVDEEKFLSPDSWVHAVETTAEKNPELKEAIHNYQGYLGQVSLNTPWEIKKGQFEKAMLDYLGLESGGKDEWEQAFKENPNARTASFRVIVPIAPVGVSGETKTALQEIRETGVIEREQYKAEIEASRKHYKELLHTDFLPLLKARGISVTQAEEFIDSKEFAQIPHIDIFCRLWSRCLADKSRKAGIEGDYNDIELLSTYIPYCDVLATDNYMKTMVKEFKIDQQYSCQIISMKEDDLNQTIDFLEKERVSRPPANQSLFSVLCTKADDTQTYSIDFLKKLALASSKFHGTGKYWNKEVYTGVFLLFSGKEKIDSADPEEVRRLGPAAIPPSQWPELQIFTSGFKKVVNVGKKPTLEILKEILPQSRGPATAILPESSVFDEDLPEYDSDLFYDIEDAVQKKLNRTTKYSIEIIHHDKT